MTKDPAGQFRIVLVVWALIAVSLGALAPKVETALAGAGWEASGSQSVQARKAVQAEFGGMSSAALQVVVHSASGPVTSGGQAITAAVSLLKADKRVSQVVLPQPGVSISRDGQTAVVQAGAGSANTNEMVRAADDLKGPLRALGGKGISSTRPTPTSRLKGGQGPGVRLFARKIAALVHDPVLAEKLTPKHPYGAKRPPAADGYYEAFNRPDVHLVDLRETPITSYTDKGIRTTAGEHEVDVIILATRFDAITGAFTRIDIRGIDGSASPTTGRRRRGLVSASWSTAFPTCSWSRVRRAFSPTCHRARRPRRIGLPTRSTTCGARASSACSPHWTRSLSGQRTSTR